jgi:imidazolonepropionase-like amidohydrolase
MKLRYMIIAAVFLASPAIAQDIAVKGERIYTSAGDPIENGIVLIRDGKIASVGSASQVKVPDGFELVSAKVVTPGLVDAHSVVGLAGYFNQADDQDQLESSEAMQPELRAIDAYNTREVLVSWLREHGVTTIHTGHGPGEIISGQTMITKTVGDTVADATLVPTAMVAATLGEGVVVSGEGGRSSPGNRTKAIAMLRAELIKAREYNDKLVAARDDDEVDAPSRDLRLEALSAVLNKDLPLLVTVHRHNDIVTALRVAEEFDLEMILDGAAESYLVLDEIKEAGVSVIIHPSMTRAWGEKENLSFTTAQKLIEAGIPVAFQSGYESYVPKTRVVLFEAAIAVQYGLAFSNALDAVTIDAARLLGVADRIGSIEIGKDGDLALFDGDPFEYTSHVIGTVIDGSLVSDARR